MLTPSTNKNKKFILPTIDYADVNAIKKEMLSLGVSVKAILSMYNDMISFSDYTITAYTEIKRIAKSNESSEHEKLVAQFAYPYLARVSHDKTEHTYSRKYDFLTSIIKIIELCYNNKSQYYRNKRICGDNLYRIIWTEAHPIPYEDKFSPFYKDELVKGYIIKRSCDVYDERILRKAELEEEI